MAVLEERSPSSKLWHRVYEQLNLGVSNPPCPYFDSVAQAIRFTGEFIGTEHMIHPGRHPLARRLLQSPDIELIEDTFQKWKLDFGLAGVKPYSHGSASIALDVGAQFVLELSSSSKRRAPPLSFIVQPTSENEVGDFRVALEEKCIIGEVTDAEIEEISRLAQQAGYYLDDRFLGNFGRSASGDVKVIDCDAIRKRES